MDATFRDALIANILAGYKEHYSFPPQGESHMRDVLDLHLEAANAELASMPAASTLFAQRAASCHQCHGRWVRACAARRQFSSTVKLG